MAPYRSILISCPLKELLPLLIGFMRYRTHINPIFGHFGHFVSQSELQIVIAMGLKVTCGILKGIELISISRP